MAVLWNVYGECKSYYQLKGHQGAIMQVEWSMDGQQVFSACTDHTIGVWDAQTGDRIKRCKGHHGIVNSVAVSRRGEDMILSGSDDGFIYVRHS